MSSRKEFLVNMWREHEVLKQVDRVMVEKRKLIVSVRENGEGGSWLSCADYDRQFDTLYDQSNFLLAEVMFGDFKPFAQCSIVVMSDETGEVVYTKVVDGDTRLGDLYVDMIVRSVAHLI